MILGVNGIRLVGRRSGVGRAIEAFLTCLGEMAQQSIAASFDEVRVYSPEPLDSTVQLPAIARNVVLPSSLPPGLWEQIVLPRAHGAQHVLFCPSYVMPLFARCPTLLVHHGSYEGYKDAAQVFSPWTRLKARVMYELSARRADIVTTVSEYSKADMLRFYKIDPHKIRVVPEGVDTRLFQPIHDEITLADWRRKTMGADLPFILYVGKPTRRRNLPNLLSTFARLKQVHHLPHKLVLIGTDLPGTSFVQDIQDLGLENDVIEIGYAAHREIVLAYNASAMLVYPSSYEGFGMPVLEAMACGTPVIALNNTAFPEFAGGVALLLPDAEVLTLEDGILQVLNDAGLRSQMMEAGPRRAASYDWRIITRMYLELLESLVR